MAPDVFIEKTEEKETQAPIYCINSNPRKLLLEYNRAAEDLASNTNSVYKFDSGLVRSLSSMGH